MGLWGQFAGRSESDITGGGINIGVLVDEVEKFFNSIGEEGHVVVNKEDVFRLGVAVPEAKVIASRKAEIFG